MTKNLNCGIINKDDMNDEESGLDAENIGEEESDYDINEIRIDSKSFSVFQVCKWIKDKELILNPDFQRKFVWDYKKQSMLIESLMLRIPIPIFYLMEDEEGHKVVIDGVQRLTTLHRYCDNKFQIKGLSFIKECNGKYFDQIDKKYQRRIEETQLVINILDVNCPEHIKFEVFRRINTGGVMLNTQEVRNILSSDRTRKLLQSMSQMGSYLEATRRRINDTRMKSQELCLRYIAYLLKYDPAEKKISDHMGMQRLLDSTVLYLNKMSDIEIEKISCDFDINMKRCNALFGKYTFSRPGAEKVINRALFSSFSVVMNSCELSIEKLHAKSEFAINMLNELIADKHYYEAFTNATTSRSSIDLQFELANKIMEAIA